MPKDAEPYPSTPKRTNMHEYHAYLHTISYDSINAAFPALRVHLTQGPYKTTTGVDVTTYHGKRVDTIDGVVNGSTLRQPPVSYLSVALKSID